MRLTACPLILLAQANPRLWDSHAESDLSPRLSVCWDSTLPGFLDLGRNEITEREEEAGLQHVAYQLLDPQYLDQ